MKALFVIIAIALCSSSICADEAASETFGACADELGPVGGGEGYKNIVTEGDYTVGTEDELIDALGKAKSGEVIYVDDNAELDFTLRVMFDKLILQLPGGVTLASGRGHNGSKGALLFSDEFATEPLISVTGENARITGLRIQGPDPRMRWEEIPKLFQKGGKELYYKFPTSVGVQTGFSGLEIDNCEVSGWSAAGVQSLEGKFHVHHCYIHHCQRRGLGYGVSNGASDTLVDHNLFDYCRHGIQCSGHATTAYEACYNIFLDHGILSACDMHGGRDRGDGTTIAGRWISVHHNTFQGKWRGSSGRRAPGCTTAVGIRGVPVDGGEIHHNWFCDPDPETALFKDPDPNVKVYRNLYGPEMILH